MSLKLMRTIRAMPNLNFSPQIISIVLVILLIWTLILTILFFRSDRRFTLLTKGISKKDLRTILEQLKHDNKLTNKEIKTVKNSLKQASNEARSHLQSIGFVRYNPFGDTGGDQSFCLALIDDNLSGIVISSLHSREQTRVYAKKLTGGKSPGYTLSKEERAVIQKAKNNLNS